MAEETGLLAEPGNQMQWREILQRAAGSPVARERWGQRAREEAEARFGWPSVSERFEHVLIQAIRSQSRARAGIENSGAVEKT